MISLYTLFVYIDGDLSNFFLWYRLFWCQIKIYSSNYYIFCKYISIYNRILLFNFISLLLKIEWFDLKWRNISFDVDHTVTGLGFQTYFVSQGSTYQISSNGREIEYIVAGAVRYRATTAGELGVEVTVTEFSMHGKVAPKVY